jgi:hypothetical protein
MTRTLALLAGIAVVLTPGGAAAEYLWCQPVPVCPPAPCYSMPVVYVPLYWWPAPVSPLAPPQVYPSPTPIAEAPPAAPPAIKRAAAEEPTPATPKTAPTQTPLDTLPARTPVPLANPSPAPAPAETTDTSPKAAPTPGPKKAPDAATIPPSKLPTAPTPPPLILPDAPPATRTPAPDSTTPPADPKKKDGGPDSLLPLVLPPETSKSTSNASPLAGAKWVPTVKVIPVRTGTGGAAAGMRKVGFFNYTARELEMVVDGKSMKLPAKHYLQAEVPPRFAYRVGASEPASLNVPDGSAGLEVVFRE